MRRAPVVVTLGLILTLGIGGASPALADVAPPQQPPGSSIKSGQEDTRVQMVSEIVLMTIDEYQPTDEQKQHPAPPFMRGHVEASFVMQNQGDDAESFDVWFPLGVDTGFFTVASVEDFHAWVDGVEATNIGRQETQGQFDSMVPWATWPATFPPGQQVTIRVTYDTFPTGYFPYGEFNYILETGAGWYQTIGEGTITYRFPYKVIELNAAINNSKDSYSPKGGPIAVSGTDVVWHFTDLEPTADNNIGLTVLAPSVWNEIQQTQAAAQASPNSAQAQLDLAKALHKGLEFKYGLVDIGGSRKLLDMAKAAYESALKLAPSNVDVYKGYLDLLESLAGPIDLPDPRFVSLLDQALKLAPVDEHLLEMKQRLDGQLTYVAEQGTFLPPTSVPAETSTPLPTETGAPVLVVTPTPIPVQPDMATPTPIPTSGGGASQGTGFLIVILVVVGAALAVVALAVGVWMGRRTTGRGGR